MTAWRSFNRTCRQMPGPPPESANGEVGEENRGRHLESHTAV